MTPEYKKALLAIAYFGMLLSKISGYKEKSEPTATIKETGEIYTFSQLHEMFK